MNINRALIFSFFILSVFFIISLFLKEKYIIIFQNSIEGRQGPVTILNVKTGKTVVPILPSVGCDGLIQKGKISTLSVYCITNEESKNYWNINLTDYSVREDSMLSLTNENFSVPSQVRMEEGSDGWRFYSVGGPVLMSQRGNATEARIIALRGTELKSIPISNDKEPYVIFRILFDEKRNKLWVMSVGSNANVLIDRIDTESFVVDFSTTIQAYLGFDFIIDKNNILISTFRTAHDADITILNVDTGEKVKEITLPVVDEKLNALSMLNHKSGILVSTTGGLFELTSDTYDINEFIPNNPGGQFTYLLSAENKIYAIDSYDRVLEIEESNLHKMNVIYSAEGKGLTSLGFFVNRKWWNWTTY